MFKNLVFALIFLSIVFLFPIRYDMDQIFLTGVLVSIVAAGWLVKSRRDVKCLGMTLLAIWSLITLVLDFQFYEMYTIIKVLIGIFAIKTIADKTDVDENSIGRFLFFVNFLTVVYLLIQRLGLDIFYQPSYNDVGSIFGKPWVMGCFATISIPLLWKFDKKSVLLTLPLIYLSHSKICAAVACMTLLFLLSWRWKVLGALALSSAAIGYALMDGDGGNHRLIVWGNVWDYTEPYLAYGKGLGSFFNSAFAHSNGTELQHWPWLHNEFYQHLFEQGIPGLMLLLGWYSALLILVQDSHLRLTLFAIGALCFFHPVLHFPKLIATCLPIFAVAERQAHDAGSLLARLTAVSVWPFASISRRTCRTQV